MSDEVISDADVAAAMGADQRPDLSGGPASVAPPAPRRTIIAGYDGSVPARAALREAVREAGPEGRVVVVHAYEYHPDWVGRPDYERVTATSRERGRALLDALILEGRDEFLDVEIEHELAWRRPPAAILDAARSHDAARIVIGARGLGPLRAALGSVSADVIRDADRPVLVVPAGAVSAG
jgi:nucleotide-binding universal stress UspA family protein